MANSSITLPLQQASGTSVDPRIFNLYQNQLRSALAPITNLPMCKSTVLNKVTLNAGTNTVQTSLGYPLTGWYIIRQRGQSQIWDGQDSNLNPNTTLILNASAAVVVDIVVF